MENSMMKRSTGLHCQACGAAAGHPCTVDCPEGGLAIAADRTIAMLTSLDLAKLPLAVSAAIGVLRSALEAQQRPVAPETDSFNTEAFERDLAAYIGHLEFYDDPDHPTVIKAHATLLAHVIPQRSKAKKVGQRERSRPD
jgi:hypothetical protein